jgi:hypothetical protein
LAGCHHAPGRQDGAALALDFGPIDGVPHGDWGRGGLGGRWGGQGRLMARNKGWGGACRTRARTRDAVNLPSRERDLGMAARLNLASAPLGFRPSGVLGLWCFAPLGLNRKQWACFGWPQTNFYQEGPSLGKDGHCLTPIVKAHRLRILSCRPLHQRPFRLLCSTPPAPRRSSLRPST